MYLNRGYRQLLRLVVGDQIMLKNIINAVIAVIAVITGLGLLISAEGRIGL